MDAIALRPHEGAEQEGVASKLRLLRLQGAWSRAVGPQVRSVAMPLAFRSRRLLVQVADAAWRRELDRLKPEILQRLAALLPSEPIECITFRPGPSLPRLQPSSALPDGEAGPRPSGTIVGPGLDLADLSAPLQRVEDPALRDRLRGVVGRYLERNRRLVS